MHERSGATLHVVQDRMRIGSAESASDGGLEAALCMAKGGLMCLCSTLPCKQQRRRIRPFRHSSFVVRPPHSGSTRQTCTAPRVTSPIATRIRRRSRSTTRWEYETCRGFGRVIGVDLGLIPDEGKALGEGPSNPGKPRASRSAWTILRST